MDERVPKRRLLDVVDDLCGLHAQLMSSVELQLWARVDGLTRDDVSRALWRERRLVKVWAMRGTLHVFTARSYRRWQAALSTYRHYERAGWLRAYELTPRDLERLVDAIARALDGEPLTREDLVDRVGRLTTRSLAEKLRGGWGSLLKPASYRGLLCFAPSDGQRVRFTRPDRWLGDREDVDPDDALRDAVAAYVRGHGPARRDDVARWWGTLSATQADRMIASHGGFAPVDVEGSAAWLASRDLGAARSATPPRTVRLLPAFDQYVVAATKHAASLMPEAAHAARVYRPQGWLTPVIVVAGRIDGVWTWERKGKRVRVTLEPFRPLPAWARKGAVDESERLAAFLGAELDLSWT